MDDLISRSWLLAEYDKRHKGPPGGARKLIEEAPSAQPKRGKWILDRSGAYCCSECMEPCAGYVMMKPRDKFCKMCGAKMEVI